MNDSIMKRKRTPLTFRPRRAALWLALAASMPLAHAAVEPAAAAPDAVRPVLRADTAVPTVDIVRPDANGVSLNAFARFDVDAAGVVLNNSGQPTISLLAGEIGANPALAQRTAQLIVAEVLGDSASQLRGQLEIAGQRADLIVANPHGIVCDGCGIVNAGRAVLAAGHIVRNANGVASAVKVDEGTLRVGPNGLNAAGIDGLELLARKATIDGVVDAEDLRLLVGRLRQSLDGSAAYALQTEGPAPKFAVDLGGDGSLHAGRIALFVTEHGAGVRSSGPLHARDGALRVRADGLVELHGDLDGHGMVEVRGSQLNLDVLHGRSGGALKLQSQGTLSAAQARMRAGADIEIDAEGAVTAPGAHWAGAKNVRLDATALDSVGGSWTAAERLDMTLRDGFDNASGGRLQGHQVALRAKLFDNSGGSLHAERDLQLRSGEVSNRRGEISAANHLALDASSLDNLFGRIDTPGDLQMTVSGALDNVEGKVSGGRSANVTVGTTLDNVRGELVSPQRLRVAAGHMLRNSPGKLAGGSGGLHIDVPAATIDNVGGSIDAGGGDLRLLAATLRNGAGALAGKRVMLRAGQVDNQRGAIRAAGNVEAQVGVLRNDLGSVLATERMELHAQEITNRDRGALAASQLSVHTDALDNVGGEIAARQQLTLHGRQLDNRGGQIRSDTLRLRGERLDNAGGSLKADHDAELDLSGSLSNRAGTLSAGAMQLRLGEQFDNVGGVTTVQSGKMRIDAAKGIDNAGGIVRGHQRASLKLLTPQGTLSNISGGRIASYGKLRWEGVELDNRSGNMFAPKDMRLHGVTVRNSDGGTMQTDREFELRADWVDNRNGTMSSSARSVGVEGRQQIDNRSGVIDAAEWFEVQSPMLLNDAGLIHGRKS